jgi:hypothetical protein
MFCVTRTEQAWWQPADRRGPPSDGVPHVQSRRGGVTEHQRGPFYMYCMTPPREVYEVYRASHGEGRHTYALPGLQLANTRGLFARIATCQQSYGMR